MPSETQIVAFAGRKGSGKDTAAKVFVDHGWVHLKLAGAMKCMLHALLAYQGVCDSVVMRMLEGDLKEEPSPFLGGKTPRHAMQTLGTEWGRAFMGEDFWVNCLLQACEDHENVVVSDVRFHNEVEAIKDWGGEVYRIERGGNERFDTHASEMEIDELDVHGVIANDAASAAEFSRQVDMLMGPARSSV